VTSEVIPDRATAYGERVRRRLTEEMTIWLTTVGRDGTPQPNPVGFLWDGGDNLLIYSQADARRLANIRRQPLVSLNFDSNGGTDIVVLTGTAQILDGYPAVPGNAAWLEKYGEAIGARFGTTAKFAERFSVPVRIHLTRVRGL
jgi:PPOX class probable F420-dependent enzyme